MTNVPLKRFKIKCSESDRWFWVCVYPTTREMIQASFNHAKETGETTNYVGSAGVCHTYEKLRIDADGKKELSKEVGIIRLAKTHLHTEVVSHEILHAAMHIYRVENKNSKGLAIANFGDGCGPKEEELCYIYGSLFHSINLKLHDHSLWK